MATEYYWVVRPPTGKLNLSAIANTRARAIDSFTYAVKMGVYNWRYWCYRGYRCEKVTLVSGTRKIGK